MMRDEERRRKTRRALMSDDAAEMPRYADTRRASADAEYASEAT